MAISAVRFKFLDQETNLPTIDFTKLTDNAVYNNAKDAVDSAISEIKNSDGLLNKVSSSLKDLQATLMSASKEVLGALKDALNSALDMIDKIEMPKIVKDIFASLKNLDLGGVKDFVKDLLHVGSTFLCNNLDLMKMFMLGYAINKNIMAGLLAGLMVTWLDRYCKGFTKDEMAKSNPMQSIEKMMQPKGLMMDASNTFKNFTNKYASFVKASNPLKQVQALAKGDFLSAIKSGGHKDAMTNLRSAEISASDRRDYLSSLQSEIAITDPGTPEYKSLLAAKGDLTTLPLISAERRDNAIQFSNLSDNLGSMAQNIQTVDLDSINQYNLSDGDKTLFDKAKEFKSAAAANPDLMCRATDSGSFGDFKFDEILPTPTDDEKTALLASADPETTDHRTNDLHPTSEVFLEEQFYA